MVGSGVGVLKRCIHTLLTLTRGHSTTLRDVTGNPCERSIWSLYSLYSLDERLARECRGYSTIRPLLRKLFPDEPIDPHEHADYM